MFSSSSNVSPRGVNRLLINTRSPIKEEKTIHDIESRVDDDDDELDLPSLRDNS